MSEQEEAWWAWWNKIEPYKHLYNLRMAWDEGYEAGKESNE